MGSAPTLSNLKFGRAVKERHLVKYKKDLEKGRGFAGDLGILINACRNVRSRAGNPSKTEVISRGKSLKLKGS